MEAPQKTQCLVENFNTRIKAYKSDSHNEKAAQGAARKEKENKTTLGAQFCSATKFECIDDNSVDLVVTSPPYPMIEMWDDIFSQQNSNISKYLKENQPRLAFEEMHEMLDSVWREVYRVTKTGGIACINIGDAVRTINKNFCLYSNHSRILNALHQIGFTFLPDILWRKETNAPNKFMGSGMLPAGAYVTYEHEYILIARKGIKREFHSEEEKKIRRESAFFWEERNIWFSDLWQDIKGASQGRSNGSERLRSAAFPFELAYRLILMYSVRNDLVLDPFLGTGTTLEAAAVAQRNAIGLEIDDSFQNSIQNKILGIPFKSEKINQNRLSSHTKFVEDRITSGKPIKHKNIYYDFPVITSQERDIRLNNALSVQKVSEESYEITYSN